MDFTNDDRFDGLYLNVAQTARGIDPLLDTVFSFLRRKTDFFNGPDGQDTDAAVAKVNEVLQKHVRLHRDQQAKKDLEKERKQLKLAEKRKKKEAVAAATKKTLELAKKEKDQQQVDDVIELGNDGFDISERNAEDTESAVPAPEVDIDIDIDIEKDSIPKIDSDADKQEKEEPQQDEDEDAGPPPVGNGGTVPGKYTWTQTLAELNVTIALPENTRGRDLNVVFQKNHLKAGLKSCSEPIVNSPLSNPIICDDSFWTVEDGNRLVMSLQKINQMEWWDSVCKDDPKIDVKKVQPENSKLDDLDGETRITVEKMMFDQRQKAMGKPTSDEQRKFEALEKFKKAHPEMDFSNAKIN